jgi:hypothetical protein
MIKLGREEPVASMDNSGKIIWAKHNEIQTVNIKSIGLDEVFFVCLISNIMPPVIAFGYNDAQFILRLLLNGFVP